MNGALVRALGNTYNAEILSAAHEPVTAHELSERLDVPIATCYRRIEELTDVGLLEAYDHVSTGGQRQTTRYRRTVDAARVEFDAGSFSVALTERTGATQKLDEAWRRLSVEG